MIRSVRAIGALLLTLPMGCALIAGLEDHEPWPGAAGGAGGGGGGPPPVPEVLVEQPDALPHALVVDETHVYWATERMGQRAIWRIPRAGGEAEPLAALPDPDVAATAMVYIGLDVDVDTVYWTQAVGNKSCNMGDLNYGQDQVMTLPKTGGTPTPLWSTCPGRNPHGIDVDGQYVFVAMSGDIYLSRIRKVLGDAEQIAGNQYRPYDLVIDQEDVFWLVRDDNDQDGAIRTVPKDASAGLQSVVEIQDTPDRRPSALAVDDTTVYWTDKGKVWARPKPGAAGAGGAGGAGGGNSVQAREIASVSGSLPAIAVDDNHVYWANATEGKILRAPKDAEQATPEVLAEGLNDPEAIAVDGEAVYWTDFVSGKVMRLVKP